MQLLTRAIIIAALLAAWFGHAAAAPSAELVRARDAFQRGDYAAAIPQLNYLLYPTPRLSDRAELAEAHLLLGVAYLETGNRGEADAEFDKALRQDPDLQLDPLFFSKEAVDVFDERKIEFKKRAARDAERRKKAERRAAMLQTLVLEQRPYYVNFIPFGAGQLQNGDTGKGIFFAVSQSLTGGTSLFIFGLHALQYGFGGAVPRDEAGTVRLLQQIQIGAGVACLGLMAWGIIDSLINYQRAVPRKVDESLIEELEQLFPLEDEKPASSFRLSPAPLPGGAGVSLQWEF